MTARLVYSIPEAAELLGCSEQHVYNLCSAGLLKRVDIKVRGKSKTRIRHDHLMAFLDAREIA